MTVSVLNTTEVLAGYTVQERLGAGGYGEVWKIEAPGGLYKAIKLVYGYMDGERAAGELKALNRIKTVRHPFLLSLERIEVVQGQLLILTELADGSLRDRFEECLREGLSGIPRQELLISLHDAADALDFMSERHSLQHLDIKPENLLLLSGRIKVADFGLVKDIDNRTVSLIGGLTPAYSAPEVLDGRPSLFSDQYSLAIVYQQMLTGNLPFPGRTPAQLAAQHLNARPRLNDLEPADREVIGRALAKNPADRFPSCRAMIESLQTPGRAAPAPSRRGTPPVPNSDTGSRSSGPAPSGPPPARAPRSEPEKTLTCDAAFHDAVTAARKSAEPSAPVPVVPHASAEGPSREYRVEPVAALEDLPPLDLADKSARLRPTLWLGIGGMAGGILRRIRGRLNDRFAGADLPVLRILLVDTDARALAATMQHEFPAVLRGDEMLPMPLRRPQDYKADRVKHVQWLSRRWLYNIPRSLQTEMLRPLGRLALIDHGHRLQERLQTTLREMVTPEAMVASAEISGLEAGPLSPRVVVIASISGGTGSGMVLDVAHLARQALAELGGLDPQVILVLLHSTSRTVAQADLARVNSYACLSELFHERWQRSYPGENTLGLPPTHDADPALRNVYLLHLGEELDEPQLEARLESLAEYFYREAATPAVAFFERCRRSHEPLPAEQPELNLRSFGLCQVGASRSSLPEMAAEQLCREIVRCWCGDASVEEPIGQASQKLLEKLELDAVSLLGETTRLCQHFLGHVPAEYLEQLVAGLTPDVAGVDQLLTTLDDLLGSCDPDQSVLAKQGTLGPQIQTELARRADHQASELVGWIQTLVEQPGTRVAGARYAYQQFTQVVRELEKHFQQQRSETDEALRRLQPALQQACDANSYRRGLLSLGRAPRRSVEMQQMLLRYACLRWQRVMLAELSRFSFTLRTRLSVASDALNDLSHALRLLAAEFVGMPLNADSAGDAPAALVAALVELVPSLAKQMDRQLQAGMLARHDGLHGVLQRDGDLRRRVPPALRSMARAEILRALKRLNMPELLHDHGPATPLQETLERAVPLLNACGGGRRLLLVVPRSSDPNLPASYAQAAGLAPSVASDSDADLTVCYELEHLSLVHAAAALIDYRRDYAEAAARMHTRTDVSWIAMPLPPAPTPTPSQAEDAQAPSEPPSPANRDATPLPFDLS